MIDQPPDGTGRGIAELRLLHSDLERTSRSEATIALLVLLTMQSPADVALMDWRDIDLPGGVWILPGLPHRTALLSSAAIGTLITRARTGVARAGSVIRGLGEEMTGDSTESYRWLRRRLPVDTMPWTLETVHQVALAEWRRLFGPDLLPVIMVTGESGRLAEQVRLRHAIRFRLDEWARALR